MQPPEQLGIHLFDVAMQWGEAQTAESILQKIAIEKLQLTRSQASSIAYRGDTLLLARFYKPLKLADHKTILAVKAFETQSKPLLQFLIDRELDLTESSFQHLVCGHTLLKDSSSSFLLFALKNGLHPLQKFNSAMATDQGCQRTFPLFISQIKKKHPGVIQLPHKFVNPRYNGDH